jgi:hypothetical protein
VGNTKSSKAGLTNFAYCKTIKTVPRDCKYSGLKKQQEACSFDKAAVVVVWMLHYNTQIQKGKGTTHNENCKICTRISGTTLQEQSEAI